ncbi:hypothetical protein GQ457_03G013040 [Hibiscus cannabinus]
MEDHQEKNAHKDQVKARTCMFTPMNPEEQSRIMYSNHDLILQRSGARNILIENLDKRIDQNALHDTFPAFGNIWSCKMALDPSSKSKGYGFVQFDNEEYAQKAIEQLNGMLLNQSRRLTKT